VGPGLSQSTAHWHQVKKKKEMAAHVIDGDHSAQLCGATLLRHATSVLAVRDLQVGCRASRQVKVTMILL